MKLYATVSSERATKGQGGQYLSINIVDEKQALIAHIKVNHRENDIPVMYFVSVPAHGYLVTSQAEYEAILDLEKGKKQKDELLIQSSGRKAWHDVQGQ